MAETSLKQYLQYIESRLDRSAYDEVAAHCRHILESFPKHIGAYQLMARSLAAQTRTQDALDLFQRVLSADPNNFVAHIGMGEGYIENESLDQAIWHFERAFEQTPNNTQLEEEIKRLYSRRSKGDRVPRKIPMSGAALGRMYMKGRLYTQAIAEFKKAVSRDPERLDLQVLLADALWRSRQEVPAGRVAGQVLRRLPNSLHANRILAQLWLRAGKPEEAKPFLNRVRELDPYVALQVERGGQPVPNNAVSIDQLNYQRGITDMMGADDVISELRSSSGIDKREGVTGPLAPPKPERAPGSTDASVPDWLSDIEDQPAAPAPATTATEPAADVPDWLSEIDDDPVPSAAAAPATDDMPDWLRDIESPPGPADDGPPTEAENEEKAPDWLSEVLVAPTPGVISDAFDDDDDMPDWMKDLSGEPESPETIVDETSSDVPDWMQGVFSEDAPPEDYQVTGAFKPDMIDESPPDVSGATVDNEDMPDWLKGMDAPEPETPTGLTATDDNMPDWLKGIDAPISEPARDDDSPGMTDWLADLAGDDSDSETSTTAETSSMPDWLADLDEESEDDLPATPSGLSAPQGQVPSWLVQGLDQPASTTPSDQATTDEESGLTDDQLPDWLRDSEAAEPAETTPEEPSSGQPPSWLASILDGSEASTPVSSTPEEQAASTAEDVVDDDWLDGFLQEEQEGAVSVDGMEDLDAFLAAGPPLLDQDDSARADMESSAPGSGLLGLSTWDVETPSEPVAQTPDPVAAAANDDAPEMVGARTLQEEEPMPPFDDSNDDDIPDWLASGDLDNEEAAMAWLEELAAKYNDEADSSAEAEPSEPEPAPVAEAPTSADDDDDLPDWLKTDVPDTVPSSSTVAGESQPGEDNLDWLREPTEADASSADDDLPDWLKSDAPAAAPAAAAGDGGAMSWLDEQVTGQDADPSKIISDELHADPPPVAAPTAPTNLDEEAEPIDEGDLPDWLKDVQPTESIASDEVDDDL
ncbi:MAG: tetratricopeptide repeat protein, partial [Chloroflexi bacterium]|nr:tetratricopeptide repeat protein [Chloroflexota bacterium]